MNFILRNKWQLIVAGVALVFTGSMAVWQSVEIFGGAESVVMGDKTINIAYTDDNTGENLIIKSDKKDYYGWKSAQVNFSIFNNSGKDQDVKVVFSAPNNRWDVASLQEFIRNEDVVSPDIITVTGTIKKKEQKPVYANKNLSVYAPQVIENRKVVNASIKEGGGINLKAGETKYFTAKLKFPNENGEFFIEAIGENAYGHLDPNLWTLETSWETSEGYSVGTVNGQNSWSSAGDGSFAVIDTDAYVGTQSIFKERTNAGHAYINIHSITFDTDDEVYFAMKFSAVDAADKIAVYQTGGSYPGPRIGVFGDGDISIRNTSETGIAILKTDYAINTWYVVGVSFDFANDKFKARIKEAGGTFGDYSSYVQENSFTTFDTITNNFYGGAIGTQAWIDYIGPTEPTPPAPPASVSPHSPLIKIDEQ